MFFCPPLLSIPAKAGISSRASGKFTRSGNINVACRRMRLSPQRFPLSREWKYFYSSRLRGNGSIFFTLRRLRGGVRARSGRGGWSISDDVWNFATPQKFAGANFYPPPQAAEGEIPACAGMERGAGMGIRGENGGAFNFAALLSPSIPAKAGISFSRQREFSAKRNIAMVACRRMRLRRRDSGFRRNGRYFLSPAAGGERGEREAGAGG